MNVLDVFVSLIATFAKPMSYLLYKTIDLAGFVLDRPTEEPLPILIGIIFFLGERVLLLAAIIWTFQH